MRWPFRRAPTPPVNMRLECMDGRVIPVDLIYDGKRRGIYYWRAVTQVMVYGGFELKCDMMPAQTTIELDVMVPGHLGPNWRVE